MLNKNSKIYVAGHNGLVGSAIVRRLLKFGYKKIITKTRNELDLTDQKKTFKFLNKIKPDFMFIAAAKVGGILTNNMLRADFIYENLAIQNNLIHGAYRAGTKNLIFLGSNCVYPKKCKQPIKEEYLLQNYLEYTNEPYAIAKIAGIKLCENYNLQYNTNYLCLMPSNLYGPNDNYNLKTSHFFPALIRKCHDFAIKKKKVINIWGNGKSKREILYVDDLADACIYFMKKKTKEKVINIGSGVEFPILEYGKIIASYFKIKPIFKFDLSKPNGTPRKILDITVAKKYGWTPKVSLHDGIDKTYLNFLKNENYNSYSS
jgi:GDP-L-fucose synthase